MSKILYFSSSWCGPCKQLAPLMERLKNEGKITYEKIDVDADTELSAKYGVRNIPTLISVDSGGNELQRKTGMQTESTVLNLT